MSETTGTPLSVTQYTVGFNQIGQRETFDNLVYAAADLAGVAVIGRTVETVQDFEGALFDPDLQARLDRVLTESDLFPTTASKRAANALAQHGNVTRFRDVFAIGRKRLLEIPIMGAAAVRSIDESMRSADAFPEMSLEEEPTAADIARFTRTLDEVHIRAATGMPEPVSEYTSGRISIGDLVAGRYKGAFTVPRPAPTGEGSQIFDGYTLARMHALDFALAFERSQRQ